MKLDEKKFKVDETRSNPMVVAMKYEDCPRSDICFYATVGSGTPMEKCSYLDEINEDCTFGNS